MTYSYTKQLEVRHEIDVFVAGGGAAGIAAAVSAARYGKRVFLAEAKGSFGGAVSSGLVPSLGPISNGSDTVASGIGTEVMERISGEHIPEGFTPFKVEELKRIFDDMIENAGIDYSFFTTVIDVIAKDGKIDYVVLSAKSGIFAVKARIYIDCTGDGDLCTLGGGEYELGDENSNVMPPTLCSLWTNIDFSRVKRPDDARVEEAINDGVFTYADRHLPGMISINSEKGIGGGNIGHYFGLNPEDERSLTKAMIWGRKSMSEYERYFKEYLTGFENMTLVYTAEMLGIRESRRILCDYMLCLNDFISRACFDDEIGRYHYAIDMHVMSTDKEEYERFQREYLKDYRYSAGESYGIPYRCLIPISFSNVLVAGRCVGTDRHMQASIRVVPGCFITGQAAGVAAALATEGENVRSVSVKQLQQKLTELGAYIPNRCK